MSNAIIRLPELTKFIQRGRASIWTDVKEGRFPAPIKTGKRSVGWVRKEVDEWIEQKILERNQK